jgi:hypothetical protein
MDKYTMTSKEFVERAQELGRAMQKAWDQVGGDEMLWAMRVDGPVYRQTPVLGRFRWYRRLRVWWLRRQLGS